MYVHFDEFAGGWCGVHCWQVVEFALLVGGGVCITGRWCGLHSWQVMGEHCWQVVECALLTGGMANTAGSWWGESCWQLVGVNPAGSWVGRALLAVG